MDIRTVFIDDVLDEDCRARDEFLTVDRRTDDAVPAGERTRRAFVLVVLLRIAVGRARLNRNKAGFAVEVRPVVRERSKVDTRNDRGRVRDFDIKYRCLRPADLHVLGDAERFADIPGAAVIEVEEDFNSVKPLLDAADRRFAHPELLRPFVTDAVCVADGDDGGGKIVSAFLDLR